MALEHIGGAYARDGRKKFRYSTDPRARVKNPDWRICEILLGLNGRFGAKYSFASQDKICELVKKYVGRAMSRRTLNRHLLGLQRDGFIRRQRRLTYHKHKGLQRRSTLYTISGRYFRRVQYQVQALARQLTATLPSLGSTRVPNPALYAETLLKLLMPFERKRQLSTARGP